MDLEEQLNSASFPAAFTETEIARFHELGYAILPNLGEEELRRRMADVTLNGLQRHIEPLEFEADLQYPGAPESISAAGGRTVRRLKQALSRDAVFMEWLQHPALLTRIRQLLGPEIACPLAHHNCIMTKEPQFSSDTGWHQDLRYWSFARPELINVWLALGPERKENGCLQLIPGSHRMSFPPESFDKDLFFRSDLPENQKVIDQRVLVELNPGDVLLFHAKALHSATRNFSQQTKYSVVFTFRALDNPPTPGSRSASLPELLMH